MTLWKRMACYVWPWALAVAWIAVADNGWTATNYVSLDGSDAYNGSSWATAFRTISNAVARAGDGTVTNTIMVSNGTYVLTKEIDVSTGITLRSLSGAAITILDGNAPATTNRCLFLNHPDAVVDGFTISNAYPATWGGGILIYTGTVQNCVIRNNSARTTAGGGIYVTYKGTIHNCLVENNVSAGDAGGIHVVERGLIENCRIIGNSAINGGGIYIARNGIVRSCLIYSNYVTSKGGGIRFDYVYNPSFPASIHNCTIVNNSSSGNAPGGLITGTSWTGEVVNVIVYGNSGLGQASNLNVVTIGPAAFSNCCIGIAMPFIYGGYNVTNFNPKFVDPPNNNYRLAADSPCINWGITLPWMQGALDIEGRTRVDRFSGIVDLGAYEYMPRGVMVTFR